MVSTGEFQKALDRLSDWRWRLDNLYSIVDKKGRIVPFRMNWAQQKLFQELHYLNVILKARQLGFTTFIQIFMLDQCLFNSHVSCGTIAHTLPDAEEIFTSKIKTPYDCLPEGLKTANPAKQDSARKLAFENGSSLRVGTSLRSGTLQYLHISEFGKIAAQFPGKAREIMTGALNTIETGQVVFVESTAEGNEGHFYDLCMTAHSLQRRGEPLTPLDFKFQFFPWWQEKGYELDTGNVVVTAKHKEYFDKLEALGIALSDAQKAWYVKKLETQGEYMQREFPSTPEEAFAASLEGAYYAEAFRRLDSEKRIGSVDHDSALDVETWWDLGVGDATAIWFVQQHGEEVRVIDYYASQGEGLAHYAHCLERKSQTNGYRYGSHIAPHDIKVRELGSGVTRLERARELGIHFTICRMHRLEDGIDAVRSLLNRCWFDAAHCADGLKCLRNYRKDWDADLGVWKSRPRHDWASHAADAFRYGAMGGMQRTLNWDEPLVPQIGTIV